MITATALKALEMITEYSDSGSSKAISMGSPGVISRCDGPGGSEAILTGSPGMISRCLTGSLNSVRVPLENIVHLSQGDQIVGVVFQLNLVLERRANLVDDQLFGEAALVQKVDLGESRERGKKRC